MSHESESNLSDEDLLALSQSKVDPKHDHLNAELESQTTNDPLLSMSNDEHITMAKPLALMTKPTSATWDISLNCECPHCHKDVDILNADDFWEDHRPLTIPAHGTEYTNNMPALCPECGKEFHVCLEY